MKHFFRLMTAHVANWYCYNNIRAVLVLILVSFLNFSDGEAFTAYATMIALGDINSMVGAYYGDKIVGHHFAWMFGSVVLLIAYLGSSLFFTSLNHNAIYLLNIISCGIGIARCNGSSLVYQAINKEAPENQKHSYNSILYLMLFVASFAAYGVSGFINEKFGPQGCFFVSFLLSFCAIVLFFITEFHILKKYFSSSFFLNFAKLLAGSLGIIAFGALSFKYYQVVNYGLWLCFALSILFLIYLIVKSDYSSDEKSSIKMFVYYIFWFLIYFVFERQFGMIMPLILSRNFDNNLFGFQNIPVTTIMSIFQFLVIVFSLIFFKFKTHDKLSNKQCLFFGFASSLTAFILLYCGSVFHINYNISFGFVFFAIAMFAFSDLFVLNRIFSICRVAPKKIHALTTAIMMVAAACSFHGARWIAKFMEIDKSRLADRAFTLSVYQNGFLINIGLLSVAFIALIIYCWRRSE